jgi:hypothetical protein
MIPAIIKPQKSIRDITAVQPFNYGPVWITMNSGGPLTVFSKIIQPLLK